jgi:hypothetical protein
MNSSRCSATHATVLTIIIVDSRRSMEKQVALLMHETGILVAKYCQHLLTCCILYIQRPGSWFIYTSCTLHVFVQNSTMHNIIGAH